jgi:hypothetical protein
MVERGFSRLTSTRGHLLLDPGRPQSRARAVTLILGAAAIGASALAFHGAGRSAPAPAPGARDAALMAPLARGHTATAAPTPTTTTTGPAALTPVSMSSASAASSETQTSTSTSTVSTLVSQVEAAGVYPGPNWSWAMGDTAASCGAIAGGTLATGCTSWSSGTERSVFAGSPPLSLVAHEVANAEAAADATPSLLSLAASAEAGTSWSPIDAVASCLVEHFMGFQDKAAGSWQCPDALASLVAQDIHQTVVTNRTDAICGTTSDISSTLTFIGTAGTLTVTAPAPDSTPQTVGAGLPVTVSGVGSFTAVDQGGTITVTGACNG